MIGASCIRGARRGVLRIAVRGAVASFLFVVVLLTLTGQAAASLPQAGPGPGGRPLWLACAVEPRAPTEAEKSAVYRRLIGSLNVAGRYLSDPARYRAHARARFSRNFIARLDSARRSRVKRELPLTHPQARLRGGGFVCGRGADGRKFYYLDLDIEYRFSGSTDNLFLRGKCRVTPAANWYARFWTIA